MSLNHVVTAVFIFIISAACISAAFSAFSPATPQSISQVSAPQGASALALFSTCAPCAPTQCECFCDAPTPAPLPQISRVQQHPPPSNFHEALGSHAASLVAQRECDSRADPTWPINAVTPVAAGYCKKNVDPNNDVCPSIFLALDRVMHDIAEASPSTVSNFVINIGARDGVVDDPLFPVLEANPTVGGVFIEVDPNWFPQLQGNYGSRFPNAQLVQTGVSPTNAVELCKGDATAASRGAPYPSGERTVDVFKFDIDGCECHILEVMMRDSFYHAKIIQLEVNHMVPPPISWRDMCRDDVNGRSNHGLDVWGCSIQAAYDVLRPHGYELLQYDWPDAVFVHKNYTRTVFPCIMDPAAESHALFIKNYWLGWTHARKNYGRFVWHQRNTTLTNSLVEMGLMAYLEPRETLAVLASATAHELDKRPLWVEVGVSGTRIKANIVDRNNVPVIEFFSAEGN